MGKRRIILFLLLLFFSLSSAWAQKTITGKVVDQNGSPILGATIAVKGTTHGTISDEMVYIILIFQAECKVILLLFRFWV